MSRNHERKQYFNTNEPAIMGRVPPKGYWTFDNRIDAQHRRMDGRRNLELPFSIVNQKIPFPLSKARGVLEQSFEEEEAEYDDR